jgi:hypothetical protein
MKHVHLEPVPGLHRKNDQGHLDSGPIDAQVGVSRL